MAAGILPLPGKPVWFLPVPDREHVRKLLLLRPSPARSPGPAWGALASSEALPPPPRRSTASRIRTEGEGKRKGDRAVRTVGGAQSHLPGVNLGSV